MDIKDREPVERRTVVMAKVQVSWEDESGVPHAAPAMLEDTSRGGACIRGGIKFHVGARLAIKRRTEFFSGIVKYCRREGEESVIGIQREHPAGANPPVLIGQNEVITTKTTRVIPEVDHGHTERDFDHEIKASRTHFDLAPPNVIQLSELQSQESFVNDERKNMETKWLHLPSRRRSEASPEVNANDSGERDSGKHADDASAKRTIPISETNAGVRSQGNLLSLDEIYRTVGIVTPREGYDVNKVAEMLNSDHIRELPPDVKRASVLMALDATGVSIDEVLKDARLRLDAMNSYESAQCKRVEEHDAMKSNETGLIRAEMERETVRYLDRIKDNLEDIALEKNRLQQWRMIKQREAERIAAAVNVFAKSPVADASSPSMTLVRALGVVGKT